jgi:hypothetical protein
MSVAQKMSLYYTISALKESDFSVVLKMLRGLTDEVMEIDELSPDESVKYEEGFNEMRNGEYTTLSDFLSELDKREA